MGHHGAMTLSFEEATAFVTGPGQAFELTTIEVGGVTYTAFRHAPPTLRDLLAPARGRGDAPFLVYEDERWSFAEVAAAADGLAAALVSRYGVGPGDRVAIAMRNYPEWVVAFAAVVSMGAVSVSLNAWWTEDELDFALEDCGATVLIADPERVARTRTTAARLGFATIAVRDPAPHAGVDRWDDVLVPGAAAPTAAIDPDDDATILYTSGTTGRPKGAVSTHRSIVQALMGFGCRVAIDQARLPAAGGTDGTSIPPVFILVVPLFHVTGCVPVMLASYASGLKLVMMHRWEPERALELIERERVTTFVGVPTQSWDLLESPRFAEFDTSSLVSVGGGGAPAPPELVRRVDASFSGGRPQIGYGMTETNAYGPGNAGDDYVTHPTSAGRATPILQIDVRDPEGQPVAPGTAGEIWFKGPNLIRGYWRRPDATAETIVDGWLRSGDIGRIDADGFVYVEDRAKDMILRAGENVYSAEVEAAIYEHPDIYEAAVFGVPHPRLGEEVAAAVVLRSGATVTVDALRRHVADRLAAFKVPAHVTFTTEPLPRNAAGKILKRDLRDRLQNPE